MLNRFSRTEMLFGSEALKKLKSSRVAVFGVGGVGGYAVEALARSGIGEIDLIDSDRVSLTNINRQIIAAESTLGQLKTDAEKARVLDINPECKVRTYPIFVCKENIGEFDFSAYNYVIDAVDTVSAKLLIIEAAKAAGTRVISSMGTGNKLDPTALEIADIYETSVCPLARVMRYELRKRGIKSLKVLYSKEQPIEPDRIAAEDCSEEGIKKLPPASCAFVPAAAGLIIAGEVIKDLAGV